MNYQRKVNESEEEYIYRVCSDKDIIGSWEEVANIINKELNYEYTESKYRKQYQAFTKMLAGNKSFNGGSDEVYADIQRQRDELYKAKVQFFDQRREYNKLLTADARVDHIIGCLKESVDKLNYERPLEVHIPENIESYDKEAVLCVSDVHYGMVTDNVWNVYNTDIARRRIEELTEKTIEHLVFHRPKVLNVLLLGDMAHGAIHVSARVQSEENVCDQIIQVSELIAQMINELSKWVPQVNVYSTYGNHMRTVQNIRESVHSDNMEKLIPWWLEQRLKDNANVTIIPATYYEFILLKVSGYNIVATHGDLDNFKSMGVLFNTLFNKQYGISVDYTISGDKHHHEEFEQLGVESTLVRSLCGTDDYANGKRLYSECGQTLMFFTPRDGKQCIYNIKFSV